MSDTTGKQVPPGMQAIVAAGQAMAQGFFDALARQHVAMQDFRGWRRRSCRCPRPRWWPRCRSFRREARRTVVVHAVAYAGRSGAAVVQPEPGDKRFAAPEWSESPVCSTTCASLPAQRRLPAPDGGRDAESPTGAPRRACSS